MAHVLKQLQDAAIALIGTDTEAGANVFGRRFFSTSANINSEILVVTGDENISIFSQSGPIYQRSINLVVICKLRGSSADLEDRANALQVLIEKALLEEKFTDFEIDISPVASETDADGSGENPVIERRITFEANILTHANDPETFHS